MLLLNFFPYVLCASVVKTFAFMAAIPSAPAVNGENAAAAPTSPVVAACASLRWLLPC
jgi:hypothetical protein